MADVGRSLISYSRIAVTGILILTPWAWGGIPEWTFSWLNVALLGAVFLWVAGYALHQRTPHVPLVVRLCVGFLLVQGWILIANAQYSYDRKQLRFHETDAFLTGRWAPGALDIEDAMPVMLRITGLLGMLCMVCGMVRHPIWRRRLLWATTGTTLSLAVYGIAERVLNLPLLFYLNTDRTGNVFASFFYHGNSGAFINLSIPAIAGLTLLAFRTRNADLQRAVLIVSLVLMLSASVLIASKATMVVTLILCVATGLAFRRQLPRMPRISILGTAGVALLALAGILLLGFDRASERWNALPELLTLENTRFKIWTACLRMLPDAGPWGIGPGNFAIAFPHYTHGLGINEGLTDACQDYLQTTIEWGWIGFLVWGILVIGGFRNSMTVPNPRSSAITMDEVIRISSSLALAGVLLHSLVDFPLQVPAIQLYATVHLGILWATPFPKTAFKGEESGFVTKC